MIPNFYNPQVVTFKPRVRIIIAREGGGVKMVGISPRVDFDSPPNLLIGGGLFFLRNHDPRGWVLLLVGAALAWDVYTVKRCRNN